MALADEIEHYARFLAAVPSAREHLSAEQFALFQEDLAKALAAVEVAWLERGVGGSQTPPRRTATAGTPRLDVEPAETIGITTSMGTW